jgi:thioredoxin reductase (NADPH)
MPGVFAAGDVRQGSTKQAASAAGEGATAALMIRQYLQNDPESSRRFEHLHAHAY